MGCGSGFGSLKEFAHLCQSFNSVSLAQGFGGNASAKLSKEKMAIKASGVRLSGVSASSGFSLLQYQKIAGLYSGKLRVSEMKADQALSNAVLPGGEGKPSMEAGFHSFLGTYVVHLHPVHTNVITCQENGEEIISGIFGSSGLFWVDYAKPGHILACKIKEAVGDRKECTIFLQNHGVIVSSSKPGACISKIAEIEEKSAAYLGRKISGFRKFSCRKIVNCGDAFANSSDDARAYSSSLSIAGKFLFPDAVVFSQGIFSGKGRISAEPGRGICYRMPGKQAQAADETLSAHLYLLKYAEKLGSPRYLSKKEAAALLSMESEKHRQKLAGV